MYVGHGHRQTAHRLALLLGVALATMLGLASIAGTPRAQGATPNEIYVIDYTCCGSGGVFRVDPISGSQTLVSSGGSLLQPVGIVIGPDGFLYVVDQACCTPDGRGGVIRVNPVTGDQTIVSAGDKFLEPVALTFDANGDLLVIENFCCYGGSVIRVNPNGGAQTVVATNTIDGGLFNNPMGIAVASNGDILVADLECCDTTSYLGGIIRINPVTGEQSIFSSGNQFVDSTALAIASNGDLYVADQACCTPGDARVVRVNPTTGAQTLVARGGKLTRPTGITIAPDGSLLVADSMCCIAGSGGGPESGGVIRINPVTGEQTVVSSLHSFSSPWSLAVAPVLSIAPATLAEGNNGVASASLTVTVSPYTSQTVSVKYATADGTARVGSDYVASNGTLTLTPGHLTGTISVPVIGDTTVEPDETLLVNLSDPRSVNLGQTQTTVTISNDDSRPTVSVSNATVTEGNSGTTTASFAVSLTNPSADTVTVAYATADGTAQAGTDYTSTSGTLTFGPGETAKNIQVPVLGDATFEPDETFTLTLSNPSNGILGSAQAIGLIRNDDVAVACTPRPHVSTSVAAGGGVLTTRVESTPISAQSNNPLREVRLGAFQNATVIIGGQSIASGQTYTVPAGTVMVELTIRRVNAGQPATVPMTVVDGCGSWQTFVGGGTTAGF